MRKSRLAVPGISPSNSDVDNSRAWRRSRWGRRASEHEARNYLAACRKVRRMPNLHSDVERDLRFSVRGMRDWDRAIEAASC